jgi:predicted Zn-dependent peptidase
LFVAAAGRVDFDALVEQVSARCGPWAAQATSRNIPAPASQASFHSMVRDSTAQQYILQLADAPASEDDDRYAAKLLATMLGDDSGSRMYWELIDPGLAESASLGHYEYLGAGMFFTWVSCAPEAARDIFARVEKLISQAEQDGFKQQELSQAQSKVKARVVLGSERPRNRLFNVGGNWMQRSEYRSVADDLAAVDAVTLDDVHRVLKEYPISRCTTVTIGPLKDWDHPS